MEDIAVHEFGHALGLSHSTNTDATMYPSYSYCSTANRTLASDDINGAKALYPATAAAPANSAPLGLDQQPGQRRAATPAGLPSRSPGRRATRRTAS